MIVGEKDQSHQTTFAGISACLDQGKAVDVIYMDFGSFGLGPYGKLSVELEKPCGLVFVSVCLLVVCVWFWFVLGWVFFLIKCHCSSSHQQEISAPLISTAFPEFAG